MLTDDNYICCYCNWGNLQLCLPTTPVNGADTIGLPCTVVIHLTVASPTCVPNLKSLTSADAEILYGKPQMSANSPSPGQHPLCLPVVLMMGFRKPQLRVKFEVAGFVSYGNIRESVFKREISFLSHPSGELGVTYGLHVQLG